METYKNTSLKLGPDMFLARGYDEEQCKLNCQRWKLCGAAIYSHETNECSLYRYNPHKDMHAYVIENNPCCTMFKTGEKCHRIDIKHGPSVDVTTPALVQTTASSQMSEQFTKQSVSKQNAYMQLNGKSSLTNLSQLNALDPEEDTDMNPRRIFHISRKSTNPFISTPIPTKTVPYRPSVDPQSRTSVKIKSTSHPSLKYLNRRSEKASMAVNDKKFQRTSKRPKNILEVSKRSGDNPYSPRQEGLTSGRVPDATSGRVPDATSGRLPDATSGRPDATSGRTDDTSGRTDDTLGHPDALTGRVPDATSGRLPDATSGRVPDATSGRLPDATSVHPDATSGRTDATLGHPDALTGRVPDATSGRLPDATSGRLPDATLGRSDVTSGRPDATSRRPDVPSRRRGSPGRRRPPASFPLPQDLFHKLGWVFLNRFPRNNKTGASSSVPPSAQPLISEPSPSIPTLQDHTTRVVDDIVTGTTGSDHQVVNRLKSTVSGEDLTTKQVGQNEERVGSGHQAMNIRKPTLAGQDLTTQRVEREEDGATASENQAAILLKPNVAGKILTRQRDQQGEEGTTTTDSGRQATIKLASGIDAQEVTTQETPNLDTESTYTGRPRLNTNTSANKLTTQEIGHRETLTTGSERQSTAGTNPKLSTQDFRTQETSEGGTKRAHTGQQATNTRQVSGQEFTTLKTEYMETAASGRHSPIIFTNKSNKTNGITTTEDTFLDVNAHGSSEGHDVPSHMTTTEGNNGQDTRMTKQKQIISTAQSNEAQNSDGDFNTTPGQQNGEEQRSSLPVDYLGKNSSKVKDVTKNEITTIKSYISQDVGSRILMNTTKKDEDANKSVSNMDPVRETTSVSSDDSGKDGTLITMDNTDRNSSTSSMKDRANATTPSMAFGNAVDLSYTSQPMKENITKVYMEKSTTHAEGNESKTATPVASLPDEPRNQTEAKDGMPHGQNSTLPANGSDTANVVSTTQVAFNDTHVKTNLTTTNSSLGGILKDGDLHNTTVFNSTQLENSTSHDGNSTSESGSIDITAFKHRKGQ